MAQAQNTCDCGNDDFLFVKDQNLDKAWKTGNKYARICTDCGSRFFLAKSMYQNSDERYVIPSGESKPIPIFNCPDDTCGREVTGKPDECPHCGAEYVWPDDEPDDEGGEDDAEEDVEPDDPDPDGEETLDGDDEDDEPEDDDDDGGEEEPEEESEDDGGDETADSEEDS